MATTLYKFAWEPSWTGNVSVKYNFRTVIDKSKAFKEQRRPLFASPMREQKASFLADKTEITCFMRDLQSLSLLAIAVPVFVEPLKPTGDIQGETVLNFTHSLVNYWNANHCNLVLILSAALALSEIKEVQTVGTSSITVKTFVTQAFESLNTWIFPCFPGVIFNKSAQLETDSVMSAEVDFREIFLDWTI